MPGIFSLNTNRRDFLRHTTLAGLTVAVAGCATSRRTSTAGEFHVALLSDTHIPADRTNAYRGFKPWENLQTVVPAVLAAKPAATLINGDAARLEGKPEDYVQLRELLSPLAAQSPIYIGLGNHDHRENFLKSFPEQPADRPKVAGKHVLVIEHPAVRIIQLDSLLYVDKVAGLLGRDQRGWLAAFLPEADARPTVLFVHHTLSDGDGDLLDVNQLFEIIRPHRQVKAIFYGHSHVWEIGERQGVKLINLPAVGYNFRDQDPVGWVDARFNTGGVALTLYAIAGNTVENGKITEVRWKS
jgi:Icc protein